MQKVYLKNLRIGIGSGFISDSKFLPTEHFAKNSAIFLYSGYNNRKTYRGEYLMRKDKAMPSEKLSPEMIKHLEFIQDVITRMNTTSFQIKGWTITIASAILALYASTKNHNFVLVAILPVLIFWFLDAYYLTQERKFRGLYNDVAGVTENPKEIKLFAIRPDLYTGGKYSYWNVFGSTTILRLYLPMVLILIGIYFFL